MRKQRVNVQSEVFQPKGEYILVRPIKPLKEETTAAGIILQVEETSLSRPTHGTVVAVGSEITDIVSGHEVFWPETDGIDMKFNDGYFVLLRHDSIIGMVSV